MELFEPSAPEAGPAASGVTPATSPSLRGRVVMVGVTASIAAYKAADICSRLVRAGAEVRVLMTPNAARMVGPPTFEGIVHRPPAIDMFAAADNWEDVLERSAEPADLYLIAPCTADAMARIAAGMADDFVAAAALAATCPILIAPAMASQMWLNPRTQRNVQRLREDGVRFIGPAEGRLASGRMGPGRMEEPEAIAAEAARIIGSGSGFRAADPAPRIPESASMLGRKVLVTAGPTQEALDPVRVLTNRSTGKMGVAMAEAAAARGAEVTLVLGPSPLPEPAGVRVVHVVTAEQMRSAAMAAFPSADLVIATAAVSDYRPAAPEPHKRKKTEGPMTVELERTPDILAEMGRLKRPGQILVGFAAETQHLLESARAKLAAKSLDAVVANDVTREGAGFGTETNIATLVTASGTRDLPRMSKREMADAILDAVAGAP